MKQVEYHWPGVSMPFTGVVNVMLCALALQAAARCHLMHSCEPCHMVIRYMPMLVLMHIETHQQAFVDNHSRCASESAFEYKTWQCAMTGASFQCRADLCCTCM